MTPQEVERLQAENAYLKSRIAQLQDDVTDLGAQLTRALSTLERSHARRAAAPPNPLGSGQ